MKRLILICVALTGWGFSHDAMAVDSGASVVVVYNSRLPESKEVAEYYAKRRLVPKEQIIGIDISTNEAITRAEYTDDLQKPLLKFLKAKDLFIFGSETVKDTNGRPTAIYWKVTKTKIRYAVLCYGMPLRIGEDPTLKEAKGEKRIPELQRNEAAVDSELALLPMQDFKLTLSGPLKSPFYGETNAAALNPTNGILLVARLDGPTPEIARGLVDKAIEAETNGLWGRAYFDVRSITDGSYKEGDLWLNRAAEISRISGFETIVDTNTGTFTSSFPMSQIALYAGWYDSDVSGPFTRPNVEFMPGAFAYHLHSYSAPSIRTATKHWVGPLLAKGATVTMGCVSEPYLGGTPDMGTFMASFLGRGMSFGEAAFACQPALSWQTTVVGDPLYRPFGKKPQLQHEHLLSIKSKLIEWSHLKVVDLNIASGYPLQDMVTYLESEGKNSAVLKEKLGDLYQAQGKPSSSIFAYTEALKHEPSHQQKIRIMLSLGEKLIAAEKFQEAFDNYELFVKELPDYPDMIPVYQHLATLAKKLNKIDAATRYQKLLPPI